MTNIILQRFNLNESDIDTKYEKIENVLKEIRIQYGNKPYMLISGDYYLNNIPSSLWKLWYSDCNHSLAVSNMDSLYLECKAGKKDASEVYKSIVGLRDALAHEFELINQGTRKEH